MQAVDEADTDASLSGNGGQVILGGPCGGQDDPERLGTLIRDLRLALGWSQGRLAAELCRIAAYQTVTRECVSRWENGKRMPGPFWLPHLAEALQVPAWELERAKMRRRDLLRMSGVVAAGAGVAPAIHAAGRDLFDAIAMADAGPLGITQTSHETDLMLAGMSACDRPSMLHLARWADEGVSAVLRVNAVGILAKTPDLDAPVRPLVRYAVIRRYGRAICRPFPPGWPGVRGQRRPSCSTLATLGPVGVPPTCSPGRYRCRTGGTGPRIAHRARCRLPERSASWKP